MCKVKLNKNLWLKQQLLKQQKLTIKIMDKQKKAGEIARDALKKGLIQIKPGRSIAKILDDVEKYIFSKGAIPAFPAQISVDNIAAHQCSEDYDEEIKEGQLIKLDCGACVDGFLADNAQTVDLGDNKEIVEASQSALNEALKKFTPQTKISEIGLCIQKEITRRGFSPVRNLSGHTLGKYKLHMPPSIPNVEINSDAELQEGQVIAVEPFASKGEGMVKESGNCTVFTLRDEKPVRSQITRQVLRKIKTYKGLPFTSRWLINEFGKGKTSFALRELDTKDMLIHHPPLADKDMVSQAEHTVIVKEKPVIITK